MSVQKLYEKIKRNPRDVSFKEIDTLMRAGGFAHRCKKSSHHIYTHPDLHGFDDMVTIPFNRPIREVYIKKALKKFELANPDFVKE
jgi:predicted RNA binding protein YcfA (HicA-like mRNA interferase family)